ncbi:MAG: glycosyltransferase [Hyphomicrobiales bacterium]|nr:MAG: glycosyltransferase [Hyphomicrobiales bacterium]
MQTIENNPATAHLFPELRDLLLSGKLISAAVYDRCEQQAMMHGLSIEEYLYKSGLVPHKILQQAIAISQNLSLEFVDGKAINNPYYVKQTLCETNGYNLIENYKPLNEIYSSNLESPHTKFATARDFRDLFIRQNKDLLIHQSVHFLADKTPNLAAKFGMHIGQKIVVIGLLFAVIMATIIWPEFSYYYISIILSCVFLFASSVKVYSLFLPKTANIRAKPSQEDGTHLDVVVDKLPIYSILVPLFKEEKLIKQLTSNLLKLNYPHSKLDIKLLFEQEDKATIAAAKRLNLPECFEFIIVPPHELQTKPRAMNFALPFVCGEYVTIYDAEDKPASDQLLKAVDRFKHGDDKLACLQASLEIENWNENWMARHFFIEYATLFNHFLPALEWLGIPLPLGGTSNHFKVDILRKIGAWDAHNVTEDADLGIRLTLCGYHSCVLNSITLEEANHRLIPWFKQRTRWLKGWLQTIIVHSRHPLNLYRAIGPLRFAGFLSLMMGMLFSSLLHPLIFVMPFVIYYTFDLVSVMNSTLHMSLFLLSFSTLIIGYGAVLCSNYQALAEFRRWRLLLTLLTAPIYWLLVSLAAWLAIREYIKNPFYWAKTEHGVSQYLNDQAAE